MVADLSLDDMLSRCGRDLTALARAGQLKRAYGRDRAVRTLLRVLGRDVRHNPLIVGPARCGKTALVYESVYRLVAGEGPPSLCNRRVVEVTPQSLLTGLQFDRGWRANLGCLLDRLQRRDDVILFLRDAHEVVRVGVADGGEPSMAAVLLGPYLGHASLYWIAEGLDWRTHDLCHRYPAWGHAFVRLPLGDASLEETQRILDAVCEDVYLLRDTVVDEVARDAIVETGRRFVPQSAFPGKAIDLLEDVVDATGEAVGRVDGEWHVTAADVYRCFSERTGLNRVFLDPAIAFREEPVFGYLSEYVLGQEPAVGAVVRALGALRASMGFRHRPLAVLLFVGPVGVGKAELARTLARFLFGSEERFVRFDMAGHEEAGWERQLFGDPDEGASEADRRGRIAQRLEDGLRVLLLDEFERAHPLVRARVRQLLEEGAFVNAMGELVDVRHVVLVLASSEPSAEERFSPALLGLVDGVGVFQPLSRHDQRRIAFRKAREVLALALSGVERTKGVASRGIDVEIEDGVVELMLERGYSARHGARFLRPQMEESFASPVAHALLAQPAQPAQPVASDSWLRLYVRQGRVEAAFEPEDPALPVADEASRWTLSHVRETLPALAERLAALETRDQVATVQARVDDLLGTMSRPGFWDDGPAARQQLTELERLSRQVERAKTLRRALTEVQHLALEAQDGRDHDLVWQALRAYAGLGHELNAAELESCLVGSWDRRDALLTIRPGGDSSAGRVWATDIARMVLVWAQRRRMDGFEAEVWDETPAPDGDGPTSIVIRVRGEGAYGLLKGEAGTHRLARSVKHAGRLVKEVLLAQVTVTPAWWDDELVDATPGDAVVRGRPLRDSGVLLPRLRSQAVAVHQPTGAELVCTCDLSQGEAEERAVWLLRAMLTARQAGLLDLESQPAWGTVVRTYDQHRANRVTDRRTGQVVGDVRQVLAGHIDSFLEASLRQACEPPSPQNG